MKARALSGIRVIDLGSVWSGPMASQLLADMGAEVIKIEHKEKLDSSRFRGKHIKEPRDLELSPYFHDINRNKLSINLNLRIPKGLAIFKDLIKISDVVIENFSVGVVEKLGIDYRSLSKVNPQLIYLSMPTAGLSGPLKNIIGYAPVYTSLGGIESLIGYPDGEITGMITIGPGDPNAAIHGAIAVLATLFSRRKTGEGRFIELAQMECVTHLLGEGFLEWVFNHRVMGPQGNYHSAMAPHGLYRCQGEDCWVSIAVKDNEEWVNFCKAMERPELVQDQKFSSPSKRIENREILDVLVTEWTRSRTQYEATEILQKAGVAAAPVLSRKEKYEDPHFKERGTYLNVTHPILGEEQLDANPWRLSKTPPEYYRHAPLVGEHNDYVFRELLHMSSSEIQALENEKVIY